MAKDPVCGMFVEESEHALKVEVKGTTYYFCAKTCLDTFTKPEVELKKLKIYAILSFALGIPALIFSMTNVLSEEIPKNIFLFLLVTPVQFIAGYNFYRGMYHAIKARSANMDTLIAIGTSAAWGYSTIVTFVPAFFIGDVYFDTAALIIAFITTGKLMEHYVKGKASDAIRKLLNLQPKMATVIRDNKEIEIPVEQVNIKDLVLIKPGEKIPVDGTIIEGHSTVDESIITGESIPVEKNIDDEVIGATMNKNGLLTIQTSKVGSDTTLAKIVKLVEEAQTAQAPIERIADRVASYFVPIVIIVSLSTFFGWFYFAGETFSHAFTSLVAVLIVACPCALGLATPAAIVVGTGKGAQNGILIKGGEHLEKAYKIRTVIFDKTGTLTEGHPSVTDVIPIGDLSENELVSFTASTEKGSEHPLAEAVLVYAKTNKISYKKAKTFETIPGHGVRADVDGHRLLLGNRRLMTKEKVGIQQYEDRLSGLEQDGKTVIILAVDGRPEGFIAIADTFKPSSKEAIKELNKMGVETIMLTGDNQRTAQAIAKQVGINRVISDILPKDKAEIVKELQMEGNFVAMVGDGINDAPALAQSDVGIAIGSGTDVAVETAGMVLMKNDLMDVPTGIKLSQSTMSKIKQNLFWAFFYNVALIPVAASGLLNPVLAAIAMALSSITVVTNSLTLKRFNPRKWKGKLSQQKRKEDKIKEVENKKMVIDPICKMTVDESSAAGKSNYNGNTYYFCSPMCKTSFDKNPEQYV